LTVLSILTSGIIIKPHIYVWRHWQ